MGRGLQKDDTAVLSLCFADGECAEGDSELCSSWQPHQAPLFFSFSLSRVFPSKAGDLCWSQKDRYELARLQKIVLGHVMLQNQTNKPLGPHNDGLSGMESWEELLKFSKQKLYKRQ